MSIRNTIKNTVKFIDDNSQCIDEALVLHSAPTKQVQINNFLSGNPKQGRTPQIYTISSTFKYGPRSFMPQGKWKIQIIMQEGKYF